MTQDRPNASELVAAVREFLERDVMAATEGRVNFHARVAVNVLKMVARELELGAGLAAAERASRRPRLWPRRPGRRARAGACRGDPIGRARRPDRAEVRAHVRATVREKLLIANPGYLPDEPSRPQGPGPAPARMRIATWNVNSLKARLPASRSSSATPTSTCSASRRRSSPTRRSLRSRSPALGYESVHNGQGQWNGVAILSRVGIEAVTTGFDDETVDPYEGDARLVAARCGGVNVVSVYVPNGREVGTEFYDRKLVWLQTLHDWLASTQTPDDPLVVLGDFNVAPEDRDVWDPKKFVGSTHVTPAERDAVAQLEKWGMEDLFRRVYPNDDRVYSYWDYRAGDFHQHRGMRIDLVLGTKPVAERTTWAVIDRNARKGTGPSDHAPVIIDLAD